MFRIGSSHKLFFAVSAGILLLLCGFFLLFSKATAVSCGSEIVCACGDTITSNYILPADLVCGGSEGLTVGANNITIDGNNHGLTGSGTNGIYSSGHAGLTVQNFSLISGFQNGIYVSNATSSIIQNNIVSSNISTGIFLYQSTSTVISGNNISLSGNDGIHLQQSETNTISNNNSSANGTAGISIIDGSNGNIVDNNTFNYNGYAGVALDSSAVATYPGSTNNTVMNNKISWNSAAVFLSSNSISPTISGNTIINNVYDFRNVSNPSTGATISNNTIRHTVNNTSRMIHFSDGLRSVEVSSSVNFSFSMFTPGNDDNTACSDCTYTAVTDPAETVTSNASGNTVSGSFTPTRLGTYSLDVTVVDSFSNSTAKNFLYFVGPTATSTSRYYLRGQRPAHGQPNGNGTDSSALSLAPASGSDRAWQGTQWIQGALDALPNYPLSILLAATGNVWYKTDSAADNPPAFGYERYGWYNVGMDNSIAGVSASIFTFSAISFLDLNFGMDYPQNWYAFTLKMWLPAAIPATPSFETDAINATNNYIDISHTYAATAAIRSLSNPNVLVLSATAPSNDASNVTLVLNNPTSGSTSTILTLDSARTFLNATTAFSSDSTSSVAVTAVISSDYTSTFTSVPLNIAPSAGTVSVVVSQWNTNGTEQKTWTENGSVPNATAVHSISGLLPNIDYKLTVDSGAPTIYFANDSGVLTFTYSGGYSTHTFDLRLNRPLAIFFSSPSGGITVSGTISLSASVTSGPGAVIGVQFSVDGVNVGSEVTASSSGVYTLADWDSTTVTIDSHILTATVRDSLGTSVSDSITLSVWHAPRVPGQPTVSFLHLAFPETISVFVDAPDDGGSPITLYTITTNPENITATNTVGYFQNFHEFLSTGVPYTFTAVTTNALGNSTSSLPSDSVTRRKVNGGVRFPENSGGVQSASLATIFNVKKQTTEKSALITWQVDSVSKFDCTLNIGLNTNEYTNSTIARMENGLQTVSAVGLVASSTYVYNIICDNSAGRKIYTDSLTTLSGDIEPPTISNIVVEPQTATATIFWSAMDNVKLENCLFAYDRHGTTTFNFESSVVNLSGGQFKTSLENILPNTLYYFRITCADSWRNSQLVFGQFQTLALKNNPKDKPLEEEVCTKNCNKAGLMTACSDKTDNDQDGLIDMADPGCKNPEDDNELNELNSKLTNLLTSESVTTTAEIESSVAAASGTLHFYLAGQRMSAELVNGILYNLAGDKLAIKVVAPSVEKVVAAELNLAGNAYVLTSDTSTNIYSAEVLTPTAGHYDAEVTFKLFNNSKITIPFALESLPFGAVEDSDGKPVENAQITVLDVDGKLWSAENFGQQNPFLVSSTGAYGFILPNGEYQIKVHADGYHDRQSAIQVTQNVINVKLAMVKFSDGTVAGSVKEYSALALQKAGEIVEINKRAAREVKKIIDDPKVKQTAETVVAPSAVVGVTAVVLPSVATSTIPLFHYVFLQPLLFVSRKKRNKWGTVYNSLTKLPVELAILRLVNDAGHVIQSRVTDRTGRFIFFAAPGSYHLQVSRNGYVAPSQILAQADVDGSKVDIYHGGPIVISGDGQSIAFNIPIDPVGVEKKLWRIILGKRLRILQNVLSLLGCIITFVVFVIQPTVVSAIYVILQVLLYVFFLYFIQPRHAKQRGIVSDAKTGKPLSKAVIRLFEKSYQKLVSMEVTSRNGQYGFLPGPNEYYLMVECPGYKPFVSSILKVESNNDRGCFVGINIAMQRA